MKGKKVLIDTSIWIDYFRGSSENLGTRVDEYLSAETVFAPAVVMAELIQGAKSERELSAIDELFSTIHLLEQRKDSWKNAGLLSYKLKGKGHSVSLTDCYMAQIALENGCDVYTRDVHFQLIAKVAPLCLVE